MLKIVIYTQTYLNDNSHNYRTLQQYILLNPISVFFQGQASLNVPLNSQTKPSFSGTYYYSLCTKQGVLIIRNQLF